MMVMKMAVVVRAVKMYIKIKLSLCWSHFQTHTQKMTVSQYVIAGPLLILPTHLLTTFIN